MNFFSLGSKPKNKYSLENLKYLYNTLVKNPIITPNNSSTIIETLRQLAEVLIWGDQNNNSLFEFFLEKNLLGFFVAILDQKTSTEVIIQLLQTLSILVENLRSQMSIYYLLSNNYINEIIIHKFDFSIEEVLDYYISFLKALSLKLDKSTINFFFNGQEKDFPLYTEAIKFINHKEAMIRIAVRTLTLSVFKVEDDAMRTYIINSTAVPYFSNIVWYIRQECANLNKVLEKSSHENTSQLTYCFDELADQFYYLHDIFNLGFDSMNLVLAEQFIQYLIFPQLIGSLLLGSDSSGSSKSTAEPLEDRLTPSLALFLLAQVFHIFTFKPLLDTVATAIASTTPSQSQMLNTNPSAPPPLSVLSTQRKHYNSFRRIYSYPSLEHHEANSSGGGGGGSGGGGGQPSSSTTKRKKDSLKHSSTNSTPAIRVTEKITVNDTTNATKHSPDDQDDMGSNVSGSPPAASGDKSNEPVHRAKNELSSSVDSGSTSISCDSKLSSKRKHNKDELKQTLLQLISKDRETFGVVCLLYSFLKNTHVDQKILESGGLLPYRLAKAKKLLEGLLSPESSSPVLSSSLPISPTHYRSKSESHARLSPISLGSEPVAKRDIVTLYSSDNADEADDIFANGNGNSNGNGNIISIKPNNNKDSTSLASALKNQMLQRSIQQKILNNNNNNTNVSEAIPILKIMGQQMMNREGDEEEFVPVPDSSQKDFTRNLIDRLFLVLVNSNQFRLITLQMTLLVLKELVYSPESPSKLTETQLALLEEAYSMVTNNLKEKLVGNLAPVFLELFEEELRSYKQISFDFLLKDVNLILPVPETPTSRLSLAKRLPSGEVEMTQKAIQQFLVLRELKYTLLRRKDTMLPLKQPQIPIVREKDLFNLDTDNFDIIYYYQVAAPQAGQPQTKKKTRNCGVLYHNLLLNVDPNNVPPQNKAGVFGMITHVAPLQRLEIEQSHLDATILRVFSHPTRWNVDMGFDEESKCQQAKALLETARDDVRSSKMRQIYTLLGERDPYIDDDPDSLLPTASSTPPTRVIVPIDASNSHPLAFSGELKPQPTPLSGAKQSSSSSRNNNRHSLTERKENIFQSFLNDPVDDYKELNLLSDESLQQHQQQLQQQHNDSITSTDAVPDVDSITLDIPAPIPLPPTTPTSTTTTTTTSTTSTTATTTTNDSFVDPLTSSLQQL
ncbi:hypothetical protein SAMD00019534_102910 [Acytostelium subglobosum LB1]|uniref:hypothetical protein n=1 Tax=Acytostelium subglobosum LB1 TaxID=1410327 RepID=UPI0006451A5F|nr:hypothetical protein SAMD00019534_102910 [Acytostelium subglobosum LB1]GAM27116.1 hypothetical protein SAMD00019534_102910 [Acytostelium subglobosum LB1]|eukprot:XP_012749996.1 hypothetical protein SAMD00019534_102910 [Acytostelium subglobosum LB1]